MYLIITTSKKLAKQANREGAAVFEYTQLAGPSVTMEGRASIPVTAEDIMSALELMPHLKGYDYIMHIIERCAEEPGYHHKSITKEIYPECAKMFDTTTHRVERAIRHSIERSFEKNSKNYELLFNRGFQKVPTNSEFIGMAAKLVSQSNK